MTPPPAAGTAPRGVAQAVASVEAAMEVLDRARRGSARRNTHGGDPGLHRNRSTVLRHTVSYLVAAAAASDVAVPGPVLDVGAGTGAFSGLLPARLGRPLHLVDTDPGHAALAAAAFPAAVVHTDLARAPTSPVVSAMEVVEHVPPDGQVPFVRALASRVVPGGVVVLSTPDESGYLGGWSGYAPHTGVLDADALHRVVTAGTGGWPVQVLRIGGPAFELGRLAAVLQPVGNRVWAATSRRVTALEPVVVRVTHRVGRRRAAAVPHDAAWTVSDALTGAGTGTGLLAVTRRPRP